MRSCYYGENNSIIKRLLQVIYTILYTIYLTRFKIRAILNQDSKKILSH